MSTYIYLECRDHEPPIRAEDESGQHLSDLDQLRTDIACRHDLIDVLDDGWTHRNRYRMITARFLRQHPTCALGIRDEYGREHPITDPTSEESDA